MSNEEPKTEKLGIEYITAQARPGPMRVGKVLGQNKRRLPGMTLTTHFAGDGLEEVLTDATIKNADVSEDGTVTIVTVDTLGNDIEHQFDGNNENTAGSKFTEGDFLFLDPNDVRISYIISKEPLIPLINELKKQ
jgi:hypothetical protein